MPPRIEACPFDATARAERCESCCETSRPLPPCAVAWLGMKISGAPVFLLRPRVEQKAA